MNAAPAGPLRGSVSAAYLGLLADWLAAHGFGTTPLAAEVTAAAADRNARVPLSVYAGLLDRAALETGDADIGLHIGQSVRPGHYGVAGFVAMNCATLGQALRQHLRYQSLVADVGRVALEREGDTLRLGWDASRNPPHRQSTEANLSAWITFVRWVSAAPVPLTGVELRHAAPADTAEHRRLFDCPIRFGCPRHAIAFPAALLELPLSQPDEAMRALMERHAQQQLQALAEGDDPVSQARAVIAARLSSGELSLEQVAAQLQMSGRALQRRLQARRLSFRTLLDQVRQAHAQQLLQDPALSLADAAFLLGFSEQSAFQRAFRRWTRESPGAYRRNR